MSNELENDEVFRVRAVVNRPPYVGSDRWPLAGQKLTPALREAMGLHDDQKPSRIIFPGTHEDYRVVDKDYLIPYYPSARAHDPEGEPSVTDGEPMARRNEALIVARARSFINNAQPELGVIRSKSDIELAIGLFSQMPDDTYMQRARKAGQFKILAGAIVTRFETLGRIITQGNAQGVQIEYEDIRHAVTIPPARIKDLKKEFEKFYTFITNPDLAPHLRSILLTDMTVDRDGVLIDLIREIGKPLELTHTDEEDFVRDGIVNKMGRAMESIDQTHAQLVKAITEKPTAELFKGAIQSFIEHSGDRFGVHSVEDVVVRLNQYAALCKARTCVRSDDRAAYDEIFTNKSVLNGLFNSENGLLESMRRVGRGSSVEVQEMRSLLKRGIKMMGRTAYTRIACNESAPEIWIPTLDNGATMPPMERYLAERFILDGDRARTKKILTAAEGLPEFDDEGGRPRDAFLKKSFCSLGVLTADFEELRQKILTHDAPLEHPVLNGRGGIVANGASDHHRATRRQPRQER